MTQPTPAHTAELGFLERVEQGHYQTKLDYPERPKRPAILNMPARILTAKQIKSLPSLSAEYDEAKCEFDSLLKAYRADQNRLDDEAYVALLDDFGLDMDDPFVQVMYRIAYEDGHSSGWSSIYGELSDLMPLYELYAAAKKKPTP